MRTERYAAGRRTGCASGDRTNAAPQPRHVSAKSLPASPVVRRLTKCGGVPHRRCLTRKRPSGSDIVDLHSTARLRKGWRIAHRPCKVVPIAENDEGRRKTATTTYRDDMPRSAATIV